MEEKLVQRLFEVSTDWRRNSLGYMTKKRKAMSATERTLKERMEQDEHSESFIVSNFINFLHEE